MAVLGSDNISHSGDFKINVNSADRVTVDTSGRLLIGTTTSSAGSLSGLAKLQVFGNTGASASGAYLTLARTAAASSELATGTNIGHIYFSDNADVQFGAIRCDADATTAAGSGPGRLVFSTTADGESTPTEWMRITSSGAVNVGTTTGINNSIGTTDGISLFSSTNTIAASRNNDPCLTIRRRSSNGTIVTIRRDTTIVGTISVTTTATAYNTSSDYRLKENVVDLDGAIDRLKQLPVHRFNFIADPDTVVDGFIAHEVQDIVPESITGTKDEVDDEGNPVYQGIDQSKLVPLLTAALQEAIAKIETLEAKVAALESA